MAMAVLSIERAGMPHLATLAVTLAPILADANAGSFHLRYQGGRVLIEQGHFTGVDLEDVDEAVANAPAHTDALEAKVSVDQLSTLEKAIVLTIIDAINIERARHSAPAITPSQAWQSVKNKVDDL